MKNFAIGREPETEEKHGYYDVGQSFSFKTITVGKLKRFAMLDNSGPVSIQVRIV